MVSNQFKTVTTLLSSGGGGNRRHIIVHTCDGRRTEESLASCCAEPQVSGVLWPAMRLMGLHVSELLDLADKVLKLFEHQRAVLHGVITEQHPLQSRRGTESNRRNLKLLVHDGAS